MEKCSNSSCKCPDCTCGAACTCGISPEVSCDPCNDFKAAMMAKKAAAPEMINLGIYLEIPYDITNEQIMNTLKRKIYTPNEFLPVCNVTTEDKDGYVYREMNLNWDLENKVKENITIVGDDCVLFTIVDGENCEVVNIITNDNNIRKLEFYKRSTTTKERVSWNVPKTVGLTGIEKVIQIASTL